MAVEDSRFELALFFFSPIERPAPSPPLFLRLGTTVPTLFPSPLTLPISTLHNPTPCLPSTDSAISFNGASTGALPPSTTLCVQAGFNGSTPDQDRQPPNVSSSIRVSAGRVGEEGRVEQGSAELSSKGRRRRSRERARGQPEAVESSNRWQVVSFSPEDNGESQLHILGSRVSRNETSGEGRGGGEGTRAQAQGPSSFPFSPQPPLLTIIR